MKTGIVSILTQAAELTLFFAAAFLLANGLLGWT
jgi:hypothetical protein